MPVINGVGQSEMTPYKQTDLSDILKQHIKTVQAIQFKHHWAHDTYFYIDMNAGPGCYSEDHVGSPVVFLEMAEILGCKAKAFLIEKNPDTAANLKDCLDERGYSNWDLFIGDNATAWELAMDALPKNGSAFGIVYSDPNGVPDFETLASISNRHNTKKIDILIRYSGTSGKRAHKRFGYKSMLQNLATIKKSHWMVKELITSDRWQWSFLMGLNWGGLGAWGARGWHKADSSAGISILKQLEYTTPELKAEKLYVTYSEYLRSPQYRIVREMAIIRSKGICERCRVSKVTEVHHIKYPPWGTVEEDASNLLAVCHKCHCEIEGKED